MVLLTLVDTHEYNCDGSFLDKPSCFIPDKIARKRTELDGRSSGISGLKGKRMTQ